MPTGPGHEASAIVESPDYAGGEPSPGDGQTPQSIAFVSTRLFLCYRRDDTADAAGRLRDKLAGSYGEDRVFMDIDSVPLGIDFVEQAGP